MSAVTVLLGVATISLAGLLAFEMKAHKRTSQALDEKNKQTQQLRAENLKMADTLDAAGTLEAEFRQKLDVFVEILGKQYEDTRTVFKNIRRILAKLPEYRHGNREMVSAGNRLRTGLLRFIDKDVLDSIGPDDDPLRKVIKEYQAELQNQRPARQE